MQEKEIKQNTKKPVNKKVQIYVNLLVPGFFVSIGILGAIGLTFATCLLPAMHVKNITTMILIFLASFICALLLALGFSKWFISGIRDYREYKLLVEEDVKEKIYVIKQQEELNDLNEKIRASKEKVLLGQQENRQILKKCKKYMMK